MAQIINIGGTDVTVLIVTDFDSDANLQDDDLIAYWDATSSSMKKATWANFKTKLAGLHYSKTEVDDLLESSSHPEGVRSTAATLTLTTAKPYVFAGTSSVWTLPAGAGVIWKKFTLINDGSGEVAIKDNGGTTIFTLYPGARNTAFYDGVNWVFIG